MIKVDVITIAMNNKEQLIKTIESIKPISEYIGKLIIKDGSKEPLLTKSDLLFENFDLVYINSKDDGPYDAMNQALKYIESDFVWFLNSGDILTSRENFLKAIDGLNTDYAMAVYNWLLDGKIVLKHIDTNIFISRIKYTWGARHQSVLFNVSIIKRNNLRYDTNLKITADRKFMLEIIKFNNFNKDLYFSKNIFLSNNDVNGLCKTQIKDKEIENIVITKEYGNFFDLIKTFFIAIIKIILFKVKRFGQ